MNPALAGFVSGLSLIVAIGAQNAFLIRQGLARNHVLAIVLICASADTALIAMGVGGLGALISALPWLLTLMRWLGVAYLLWFGFKTAKAVFGSDYLDSTGEVKRLSLREAVATALMLTFLNPHVYLDTVIFLGSIGNQFGSQRWWFVLGAAAGSWLWFSGIGFGAQFASKLMARTVFWRVLDGLIAVIMFALAGILAFARLG